MNPSLEEELKELGKELGVIITTPNDKLNSYLAGLDMLRGTPGTEAAQAGQRLAIGDQYVRMGNYGLAMEHYMEGLRLIQGREGSEIAESHIWQSVGRLYELTGQRSLAIVAYKSALGLVKKATADGTFPIDEAARARGIESLQKKIDDISSLQ